MLLQIDCYIDVMVLHWIEMQFQMMVIDRRKIIWHKALKRTLYGSHASEGKPHHWFELRFEKSDTHSL